MKSGGRPGGILSPAAFEEALARDEAVPPVVVAAGLESLLRDQVLRAAVAAALGDPDSPDAIVLHGPAKPGEGESISLAGVIDDVRTPSMFAAAGRKVVLLRRADLLLAGEGEALLAYLARPAAGSLLVLAVESSPGDRNAPAKVRAALEGLVAKAVVVNCDAPSAEPGRGGGPSPLALWAAARARGRGKRLDPADGELLVHRSGTALGTLDAAVAAAVLHAGAAERISPADIEAVAPRGPAEGTDRFVEAMLCRDAPEALRVLSGLYREGAYPWGAKSPTRGEGPITHLLLNQVRRLARDARAGLAGGPEGLPPSLKYGCREPRRVLKRSTASGLASLLSATTELETAMKSGASGAERARFEALVLRYAAAP